MRKFIVLLSLIMAFPASALAEPTSQPLKVPEWTRMKLERPKLKFQKKKLWNLAALPAYFFVEVNLHEGSHTLTAMARGYKVAAYKPYPHMYEGRFLWGAFYTKAGTSFRPVDDALITIAPYITDVIIFTSVDLLLGFRVIPPESVAGLIVYTVGMLAPWINFVYNINNVSAMNDFSVFAKVNGANRWVVLAVGDAIAAFAAWRLWVRGRDVLFSAAPVKEKPSRVTVAPLMGGVNGAMVGIKF